MDEPVTATGTMKENAVRGTLGLGGPPLKIQTGDGSIRLMGLQGPDGAGADVTSGAFATSGGHSAGFSSFSQLVKRWPSTRGCLSPRAYSMSLRLASTSFQLVGSTRKPFSRKSGIEG